MPTRLCESFFGTYEHDFGQEAIQLNPPNILSIQGSRVIVLADMNWRYHDGLIKVHGTAKDIFNQTTLRIDLGLVSSDGHLGITVPTCNVDIKDFAIILDGGAGGFYQVRVFVCVCLFLSVAFECVCLSVCV